MPGKPPPLAIALSSRLAHPRPYRPPARREMSPLSPFRSPFSRSTQGVLVCLPPGYSLSSS